jgi:hypothetical protein
MGIPEKLVLEILKTQPTPNFVETGTFRGGTTLWAARHFKKVVTIEINSDLSHAVANRRDCPHNIQFLVGNSAALMPEVVSRLDGPALFWLDGHYCGPGTGDTAEECPIMEELAALTKVMDAIVLIDDARCFLGPPPPPHNPEHWVNIDVIFRFFAQHFPNHFTTIHDDVIIAAPLHLKQVLDRDWIANFSSRFAEPPPQKPSILHSLIKRAAKTFAK